jgi:hypothetical protein
MRSTHQWVGNIVEVRERLIGAKGVRDDVAFQNDVNAMLSAVADMETGRPRVPHGIEAAFGLLPLLADGPEVPRKISRARAALSQLARMRRGADRRPLSRDEQEQ